MAFITVASFDQPSEADLVRSMLEAEGIQVSLADDNLIGTDWLYANAVGGVKLNVAASQAEAAHALVQGYLRQQRERRLARQQDKGDAITFACDQCHQTVSFPQAMAGMVEDCPVCGKWVDIPEAE